MNPRYKDPCWVVLPLVFLIGFAVPAILFAAMSDSKAATEAFKIWGIASWKGTAQSFIQTNATKRIGYLSPGCQTDITVVGQGSNTWDAAFASLPLDKGIGGTFGGQATLQVQSPGVDAPPAISSDPTPGIVTSVQVLIDNAPLGAPVATGQTGSTLDTRTPWMISIPWDTTRYPDGFHVMCAQLIHPDGSYARTHASMLIVKQTP